MSRQKYVRSRYFGSCTKKISQFLAFLVAVASTVGLGFKMYGPSILNNVKKFLSRIDDDMVNSHADSVTQHNGEEIWHNDFIRSHAASKILRANIKLLVDQQIRILELLETVNSLAQEEKVTSEYCCVALTLLKSQLQTLFRNIRTTLEHNFHLLN